MCEHPRFVDITDQFLLVNSFTNRRWYLLVLIFIATGIYWYWYTLLLVYIVIGIYCNWYLFVMVFIAIGQLLTNRHQQSVGLKQKCL